MVRFGRRPGDGRVAQRGIEDPVVRQYRFLLREASPDAVEVAHVDALSRLTSDERHAVLSAVQRGLVAGQRLGPDDTGHLAHLIVTGERRSPNAFLTTCDPSVLGALSAAVIHSDACFGLFGRYGQWDGADPEPADESLWRDAGFNPDSGRWNPQRTQSKSWEGGAGGSGGGLPDSGGGF